LATALSAVPVIARYDQHGAADGLAREAGAGGAECYRHPMHTGQLGQRNHLQRRFAAPP
jgi:hypothetical protein